MITLLAACSSDTHEFKRGYPQLVNQSLEQKVRVNSKHTPTGVKKLLDGIVICIDPEHQKKQDLKNEPIAPGSKVMKEKTSSGTAGTATKVPEYKLNLDVSLKLNCLYVFMQMDQMILVLMAFLYLCQLINT